jgi:uncharacterized protein YegL
MPERGLPPVLVLVSDGEPTDDFRNGLRRLLAEPWGRRAVRIAIAIGDDASLPLLAEFISDPEIKPLRAANAHQLHDFIRWASTAVLMTASSPPILPQADRGVSEGVPIPSSGIVPSQPADEDDVW